MCLLELHDTAVHLNPYSYQLLQTISHDPRAPSYTNPSKDEFTQATKQFLHIHYPHYSLLSLCHPQHIRHSSLSCNGKLTRSVHQVTAIAELPVAKDTKEKSLLGSKLWAIAEEWGLRFLPLLLGRKKKRNCCFWQETKLRWQTSNWCIGKMSLYFVEENQIKCQYGD